mmetsp:Transcript_5316/g.13089  ORF Transcript_5316/g.13089 Transcript_5316/m.13089 type:complete len:532 (-) Transcript_5316:1130-2725(-)
MPCRREGHEALHHKFGTTSPAPTPRAVAERSISSQGEHGGVQPYTSPHNTSSTRNVPRTCAGSAPATNPVYEMARKHSGAQHLRACACTRAAHPKNAALHPSHPGGSPATCGCTADRATQPAQAQAGPSSVTGLRPHHAPAPQPALAGCPPARLQAAALRASSADGAAVRDARNVQVLAPLLLDVRGGERGRAQRLLRLVLEGALHLRQDEGRLVVRGRGARDAVARVPALVDALAGVVEVQLYALLQDARGARHDDRPLVVGRGHGGHEEALAPLLLDPLEGERVRHLVALLREAGALGHDHQRRHVVAARDAGDVVPLLPLLHDPVLGQEGVVVHLVDLLRELGARVHHDGPQVGTAGHAADVQPVLPPLLHVHQQAAGVDVVVVPLLHGRMLVVDGDPLLGAQAGAHLLAWRRRLRVCLKVAAPALLAHNGLERSVNLQRALRQVDNGLKQANVLGVVGLLLELEIDHDVGELAEGVVAHAAQLLRARRHLLAAHPVALVVAQVALPGQAALEQEQQRVGQRLQVVAA